MSSSGVSRAERIQELCQRLALAQTAGTPSTALERALTRLTGWSKYQVATNVAPYQKGT